MNKRLIASHIAALVVGYCGALLAPTADFVERKDPPVAAVDRVLDGDTVVKDGVAYHVRGVDAAELGPWANCWAEAALAGFSKDRLEGTLGSRSWTLVDAHTDQDGRTSVRLVDEKGYDIADDMRVYGGAALTDQRWNWCARDVALHSPGADEQPPVGPNLWWPSGNVYDPRAAD